MCWRCVKSVLEVSVCVCVRRCFGCVKRVCAFLCGRFESGVCLRCVGGARQGKSVCVVRARVNMCECV